MELPSHIKKPKLCSLRRWENYNGYGFNLHSDKGKQGQFIGKVDPNSPAELGGICSQDVLIEVNGIDVEEASHNIVVGRVKSIPNRVDLFVCHPDTYKYCKENNIKLSSVMNNIEEYTTPERQPAPVEEVEERPKSNAASSQRTPSPPPSFTAAVQQPPRVVVAAPAAAAAAPPVYIHPPPMQQQQQQQPRQQQQQQQQQRAAVGNKGGSDPVGNVSLEDVRSRVGQNKRNQVKMMNSTFSEKYSVFESL